MLPATHSTASGERGGQDLSMGHAHASSGERGMAAPHTATAAPGAEGTHQIYGSANAFEPLAHGFSVPLRAHASRKQPAPHAIHSRTSSVMTTSVNMSNGHPAMQPAHASKRQL